MIEFDEVDELYELLHQVEDLITDMEEINEDIKDSLYADISSMISTISEAVEDD